MVHLRTIHKQSERSYGRPPRMTEELYVVWRLMRENDIYVVRTRRSKVTINSTHRHAIEPNPLGQNFSATTINQEEAVDIAYIRTHEG